MLANKRNWRAWASRNFYTARAFVVRNLVLGAVIYVAIRLAIQ